LIYRYGTHDLRSARGLPAEEFALGLSSFGFGAPIVVVLTGWIADDWIPATQPASRCVHAGGPAVAQVLSAA
jgi:hypothetical protein